MRSVRSWSVWRLPFNFTAWNGYIPAILPEYLPVWHGQTVHLLVSFLVTSIKMFGIFTRNVWIYGLWRDLDHPGTRSNWHNTKTSLVIHNKTARILGMKYVPRFCGSSGGQVVRLQCPGPGNTRWSHNIGRLAPITASHFTDKPSSLQRTVTDTQSLIRLNAVNMKTRNHHYVKL